MRSKGIEAEALGTFAVVELPELQAALDGGDGGLRKRDWRAYVVVGRRPAELLVQAVQTYPGGLGPVRWSAGD
ncbi:hypothetical protein, partial [Frankia sp. AiPa1]|uniref:hypothetical protein n=1 Tax=Frankia sp. AiPa1 TaxID=573492 RepID=UPI00202B591F